MTICPICKKPLRYAWKNVDLLPKVEGKTLPGFEISCAECEAVLSISISPDDLAECVATHIKAKAY